MTLPKPSQEAQHVAHRDRAPRGDRVVELGVDTPSTRRLVQLRQPAIDRVVEPQHPSSTRSMVAAAAIGLVSEAIRKMVSRRTGGLSGSVVAVPIASTKTSSPRATSATIPGISPRATKPAIDGWSFSVFIVEPGAEA